MQFPEMTSRGSCYTTLILCSRTSTRWAESIKMEMDKRWCYSVYNERSREAALDTDAIMFNSWWTQTASFPWHYHSFEIQPSEQYGFQKFMKLSLHEEEECGLTVIVRWTEGVVSHTPSWREDDKISNGHPRFGGLGSEHSEYRWILKEQEIHLNIKRYPFFQFIKKV